jgi:hypothetical protein
LLDGIAVEQAKNEQGADAGIRLQTAFWVQRRDEEYGWWGVVSAGEAPKKPLFKTTFADAILLPSGLYDVYWKQDYEHDPMLVAAGVDVRAGGVSTTSATAGIQLRLAPDPPQLDAEYGWWGVVKSGDAAKKRVNWWTGRFDQPLLVAPGTYDVVWQKDYHAATQSVKTVDVKPGELLEVELVIDS